MAIPQSAPRGRRRRWGLRAWHFVVPALVGLTGSAQGETPPPGTSGLVRTWSDARQGLDGARTPEERLRAIARLGASRDPRAVEALALALAGALAPAPSASPKAALEGAEADRLYLALAYALAEHAEHLDARRALARLLVGVADGPRPLDALAAGVAANALAVSGTADALETLGRALQQRGSAFEAARSALVAHPPRELAPLLDGSSMNRALVELLGDLGDQRAFLPLREVVRKGPATLRAPAAWALHRLGAMETEELARHWWRKSQAPSERVVALRILTDSHDPLGVEAIAQVLTEATPDPASLPLLEVALEEAARSPRASWEPALLALARGANERGSELALIALARLDTATTRSFFTAALAAPDAPRAARVLAQTIGAAHEDVLVDALSSVKTRVWALRSLAVRLGRHDGVSASTRKTFERVVTTLLASPSETERAAAAWSRTVAEPQQAASLFASRDETVLRAAGRQAFAAPLARAAAARLERRTAGGFSPELAEALSPSLLNGAARRTVTTQALRELGGDATSALPSFALALTAQSTVGAKLPETSNTTWQEVRTWLGSADPALRAATARGLGLSPEPASVSLLSELLRWDPEPTVRRAAALALRKRREPTASRTLTPSSLLDPDAIVRALAQRAPLDDEGASSDPCLSWLENARGPLRLTSAWGESLLVYPDPDGFVGVVGFGPEPVTVAKLERAREALSGPPKP
jgi:HEAT repeat protein